MALNDINKDELQDFAEAVDVDDSGNKSEIVERLEAEGYTEENVRGWQEGTFDPTAERDPEEANAEVEEAVGLTQPEEDAREADDEEKLLIKLDGPFSSITTHGVTFTQDHPFVPVKKSVAEELLKSQSFRQAHPSEADEFYG